MKDRKIMSVEMTKEAYDTIHMLKELNPKLSMKDIFSKAIMSYGEKIKPLVDLKRKQQEERDRLAKVIGVQITNDER